MLRRSFARCIHPHFFSAFRTDVLKEPPNIPVLCAGGGIAVNRYLPFLEVTIAAVHTRRLAFPTTAIGKKLGEIRTTLAKPAAGRSYRFYHLEKLLLLWQFENLLPDFEFWNCVGGVPIACSGTDTNLQNMPQRAHCVVVNCGRILLPVLMPPMPN